MMASLAQWIEQHISNVWVAGSIPARGTCRGVDCLLAIFIPRFLRSWNVEGLPTTAQAAERLQISTYVMREKLRRKEIESIRIGNSYRIRSEWLEEFIERQAA